MGEQAEGREHPGCRGLPCMRRANFSGASQASVHFVRVRPLLALFAAPPQVAVAASPPCKRCRRRRRWPQRRRQPPPVVGKPPASLRGGGHRGKCQGGGHDLRPEPVSPRRGRSSSLVPPGRGAGRGVPADATATGHPVRLPAARPCSPIWWQWPAASPACRRRYRPVCDSSCTLRGSRWWLGRK